MFVTNSHGDFFTSKYWEDWKGLVFLMVVPWHSPSNGSYQVEYCFGRFSAIAHGANLLTINFVWIATRTKPCKLYNTGTTLAKPVKPSWYMLFYVEKLHGGIIDCRWIFVVGYCISNFSPGDATRERLSETCWKRFPGLNSGGARKQAAILELQSYEYTLQEAIALLWYAMVQMAHLGMIYPQQDLPELLLEDAKLAGVEVGERGRDESPDSFQEKRSEIWWGRHMFVAGCLCCLQDWCQVYVRFFWIKTCDCFMTCSPMISDERR